MTNILVQTDGGRATVTLNRPEFLNALSPDMAHDLHHALLGLKRDKGVRCVVLEGAGRGFMAGGDIGFFQRILPVLGAGETRELAPILRDVHGIIETLRTMPAPVIGALHGAVAGFGVSLAAACDLAVAVESARFTLAYCHIGTSPDGGSSYILPRVIGFRKAMELALLGNRFDAREALALGLVNRVVPDDAMEAALEEWTGHITEGPRLAYARTKALLYGSLDNSFEEQIALEEASFKECARTTDFAEGVAAFMEKRKAKFG